MTNENDQQIHENLINHLNTLYKTEEGQSTFHIVPSSLSTDKLNEIDISDINRAVKVFVKILNLNGGSNSDVNLYELMQVYLKHPKQRHSINELVKEVLYKR